MENVNKQLLALVKSFGHKAGCAKNAFGEQCTCGVDEAIAAAEQAQQVCRDCNGTGNRDSGGVQPWGEGIMVPCDCQTKPQAEPVAWEYREFHDDSTTTPGWGKWKRIESEEWAGRAIKSVVADIHEFIAQGYRYEIRELYAQPPAVPNGYVLVPIKLAKAVIDDDSSWHAIGYAEPGKYGAHAVDLACLLAAAQKGGAAC